VTNTVKFRGDGDIVVVDIGAGVGAQEVFTVSTINEAISNGQYWTFSTTERDYHVWYSTIDGDPQDPANPFLANLSSIGIPVTFASATASTSAVATATRDALNRLTGEVSASLVNNSTIQVAVKKFGSAANAADGTAGVTVTVDTAGVDRSTIIPDYVITGSAGNVTGLVDGTDFLDLEGSTYLLVSVNTFSASGTQVVASAGDTAVKSDNLVLNASNLGGLGSTIGGIS
jgi:hypothetical protein